MTTLGINDFVVRQCQPDFTGTRLSHQDLNHIHGITGQNFKAGLIEMGDFAFSRIVVLRNQWEVRAAYALVTDDNRHLLQSEYVTRQDGELPYLSRFFKDVSTLPMASHLHVIMYSREQLEKEGASNTGSDFDIISVQAEMGTDLAPMTPSTMIRNHMGHAFGGNGEELNTRAYKDSASFWSRHAMINN